MYIDGKYNLNKNNITDRSDSRRDFLKQILILLISLLSLILLSLLFLFCQSIPFLYSLLSSLNIINFTLIFLLFSRFNFTFFLLFFLHKFLPLLLFLRLFLLVSNMIPLLSHRNSKIVIRIVASFDVVIGKIDVDLNPIGTGILRGNDLHYVASLPRLSLQKLHFLTKEILILTVDIQPHFLNSLVVKSIQQFQLPSYFRFRRDVALLSLFGWALFLFLMADDG